MIPESVAIRQRGAYDFESCYANLCALQDTVPLVHVTAHLKQGVVDINGDKVRMVDWAPILNTIKINKSLRYLALRSYFQQSSVGNGKKAHYFKRRTPAICMKDVTLWVSKAVCACLSVTKALRCIDLQGVPLREKDVQILSKGVSKNISLTHILFDYCQISDSGVNILCQALKNHLSVTHVSLAGCNITPVGVESICNLIKHQSTQRYSDAWAESLRYRVPNLDCMGGIRRITLNSNPLIGDAGSALFAEALKDDLWLKALDLQQCGLSSNGAISLLNILEYNTTLCVLDVRRNPMVDTTVLREVLGKVLQNADEKSEMDFPWIKEELPKDPYKTKRYHPSRNLNRTFCKKSVVSKKGSSAETAFDKVSPGHKGYVPWRTAVRAARRKRGYSDDESDESVEAVTIVKNKELASVQAIVAGTSTISSDDGVVLANTGAAETHTRKLKIELMDMRRRLHCAEENETRLNSKIIALEIENAQLKQELNTSLENSRLKSQIDDEVLLDSIDQSFNKFHEFLNMLSDLGLGSLAEAAGLDQLCNPFGNAVEKDSLPKIVENQNIQETQPVNEPIVIQGSNPSLEPSQVDVNSKLSASFNDRDIGARSITE